MGRKRKAKDEYLMPKREVKSLLRGEYEERALVITDLDGPRCYCWRGWRRWGVKEYISHTFKTKTYLPS